ncbi:MAG TPA: polyprenyl synthetase family protein [Dehalococcoidia bacterium]|nr:polyprenyl synthetase family protein [Dehalococcoidia bacterium]
MTQVAAEARVNDILSRYRGPVLAGVREAIDGATVGFAGYMRYHFGWEDALGNPIPESAGKMLRPALCLLCCEAAGGDAARAMPAAVALELVHNFTLLHDDIEDGSETRHGRTTLWKVAGIPQAINTGDGMFVLAHRTMLRLGEAGVPVDRALVAAQALDDACVALCDGQYADIGFELMAAVGREQYERMIAGKTAALLGASAEIGAIAGGADDRTVRTFRQCGRRLGMAFQVQDDVLGIWGDEATTGKPVADDIRSRKKSFPVVYALERLDERDRARMAEIYAHRRMGSTDVNEVLRLLEVAGAHQASTDAARRYADEAMEAVAGIKMRPELRADLEALAAFFVQRAA